MTERNYIYASLGPSKFELEMLEKQVEIERLEADEREERERIERLKREEIDKLARDKMELEEGKENLARERERQVQM